MTSLNLKYIRTHVWTDSQIVLYWTQSSKKLPTFVAHRVKEIRQLIEMASWKYCPTNEILPTCLQEIFPMISRHPQNYGGMDQIGYHIKTSGLNGNNFLIFTFVL